ncbi:MAG: hypothetical protein Q6373_023620 [Candidatus Sigynarchaeota archaeon]
MSSREMALETRDLYILREPEAPLLPVRQLVSIAMMKDMVDQGCQFYFATWSPMLMACPGVTWQSIHIMIACTRRHYG